MTFLIQQTLLYAVPLMIVALAGVFMAMLDIVGQNLTGFTAYNEYITDVIIAVIVYLSAFSLVIQMWFAGKKKKEKAPKKGGEQA